MGRIFWGKPEPASPKNLVIRDGNVVHAENHTHPEMKHF